MPAEVRKRFPKRIHAVLDCDMLADVNDFMDNTVQYLWSILGFSGRKHCTPKRGLRVSEALVQATGLDILFHLGNDRIRSVGPDKGVVDPLHIVLIEREQEQDCPIPDMYLADEHYMRSSQIKGMSSARVFA